MKHSTRTERRIERIATKKGYRLGKGEKGYYLAEVRFNGEQPVFATPPGLTSIRDWLGK